MYCRIYPCIKVDNHVQITNMHTISRLRLPAISDLYSIFHTQETLQIYTHWPSLHIFVSATCSSNCLFNVQIRSILNGIDSLLDLVYLPGGCVKKIVSLITCWMHCLTMLSTKNVYTQLLWGLLMTGLGVALQLPTPNCQLCVETRLDAGWQKAAFAWKSVHWVGVLHRLICLAPAKTLHSHFKTAVVKISLLSVFYTCKYFGGCDISIMTSHVIHINLFRNLLSYINWDNCMSCPKKYLSMLDFFPFIQNLFLVGELPDLKDLTSKATVEKQKKSK